MNIETLSVPTAEQIKTALLACAVEAPEESYPCERCYLYPFSRDGRMSTGKSCFEHLTQDVIQLIDRLNDFGQTQAGGLLALLNKTEKQERKMQQAFALSCRYLADSEGCPAAFGGTAIFPECEGEMEACGDDGLWACWQRVFLETVDGEPVCRICGCTQENACPNGCSWVKEYLCSACAGDEQE